MCMYSYWTQDVLLIISCKICQWENDLEYNTNMRLLILENSKYCVYTFVLIARGSSHHIVEICKWENDLEGNTNILFACAQINETEYFHQCFEQNLQANAIELFCSWSNFIGPVRFPVFNSSAKYIYYLLAHK